SRNIAPAVSTPRINFAFQFMMVSLLAHASRLLSRKRRPRTRGKYIPSFKGLQQEVFGARQEAICWVNGLKRRVRRAKAGTRFTDRNHYLATNCDCFGEQSRYLASLAFRSAARLIWNSGSTVSAR